jgi:hypothetical protein
VLSAFHFYRRFLQELAVKLFQPVGGQCLDGDIPDVGKDVVVDAVLIAGESALTLMIQAIHLDVLCHQLTNRDGLTGKVTIGVRVYQLRRRQQSSTLLFQFNLGKAKFCLLLCIKGLVNQFGKIGATVVDSEPVAMGFNCHIEYS